MAKIKEYGYYAGKGMKAENNLLAYWTQVAEYNKDTPHTATDPDSPILALLRKPLTEFGKYVSGDFDDMPRV